VGPEDKIQFRCYPGSFAHGKKRPEENNGQLLIFYSGGLDKSSPYNKK
jgi:hypothetical protein